MRRKFSDRDMVGGWVRAEVALARAQAEVGLIPADAAKAIAETGRTLEFDMVAMRHGVTATRVAGLWAGVDIDPAFGTGREIAEKLLHRGVLVKDTHGQTIRIAPPLVVRATELDWAVEQLRLVLAG